MSKKFLNIIIADDDADDQLLARQAICEVTMDHEIIPAFNGFELLSILEKKATSGAILPDFILLDINMPMLNGFEALSKIRKNPLLKEIPIFILSTSHSEVDQDVAQQLGANGFYTKPVTFDKLKKIMEEITAYAEIEH